MLAKILRHRAALRVISHEIRIVVHGHDFPERRAGVERGDKRLSHGRERGRGERMKMRDAANLGSRPITAEMQWRLGRRFTAYEAAVGDLHDRDLRGGHPDAPAPP